MLTHGGMSFHGGVIGVMLAAWRCVRTLRKTADGPSRHVTWPHLMDLLAFASTIGLGLGRIANFINGELLGKIVAMPGNPAPWWSVKYPQELLTTHAPSLTPVQSGTLAAIVGRFMREGDRPGDDIVRMIAALQRGGPASRELAAELAPLLAARHPSQLYQAFLEGVVLTAILWFVWRKPRRAGIVGSWFLIGYGVMRIAAEFIRLPDDNQSQQLIAGFSRGQWLSVGMILLGVAVLASTASRREPQPRFGGWLRQTGANP
jgi:phosphatidylglycerol:prolipoprotein diacylglycerol transferase